MTLTIAIQASSTLLTQLALPAVRALALAGAAGFALAAFRVKATTVRLLTWTAVLYAALAMPLLGWLLPPLSVPTPVFLQHAFSNYTFFKYQHAQPLSPASTSPQLGQPAQVTEKPESKKVASSVNVASSVMLSEERAARTAPVVRNRSIPTSPVTRPPVATPAEAPTPVTRPANSISWTAIVTAIYIAIASLLLLRFFVGLAFSRRLLRASQAIDDARVTGRLAAYAHVSGLAFIPRAAESELISVPVAVGALRSAILLPAAWCEWDNAKLDAVIVHEVSHVARRDALTQYLSVLHRAIFWFSPLAWWLDHHLANLAEQASDEAALSCGADRKHYARTLLEFFEALQAAPRRVWWQGVSMAKAGQAEERVERILSWKGTVAMGLQSSFKKSITIAVAALAVPLVYLAAAAHPVTHAQIMHPPLLAQEQTPPSAPRPARAPEAQPGAVPEPAAASTEVTPLPAPDAEPKPPTAPAAVATPMPPQTRPSSLAPKVGTYSYAAVSPVAPAAPVAPPAPRAAWSWSSPSASSQSTASQSASPASPATAATHASSRRRSRPYLYGYGYDDDQRFVIASGKTDALTMSGSSEDAEHVEKLRKTIPGDFIWFQRDEKSYIIRDQATIDRARELWAPQEELGAKQEALGKQQEILGKQQEELGTKMEQIHVNVPDMTADLDKLKAELKALSSSATVEQVGHIQSEIGELQSKIGELQSQAGEQQSKLGDEMGTLGEKQGKLGEEQGRLGEQQGELAQKAAHEMKQLLDEALSKGTAQPEP